VTDDFPYMQTVGNLDAILAKIKTAGTPAKFTHDFLKTSLGFSSSSDRGVIKVLRQLGFLTSESVPTSRYNEFRQASTSGRAMAVGLREGWAPIFLADQQAHTRSAGEIKETFKNVTGKAESVSEKMASMFKALAAKADFNAVDAGVPQPEKLREEKPADEVARPSVDGKRGLGLGVGLHNDIHIHLPPTSDVAVYTAIFRAIRDELLD